MSTSVSFPPRASKALGFLKSGQNDIEIFVEDTAAPNMWVRFLQVYLPEGVRLNSVSVLGSREAVIQACQADQSLDSRRKLYIIDADLDILRGVRKPRLRHLYRLRAYCIENYLVQDAAFIETIRTLDAKMSAAEAAQRFKWKDWFDRNDELLERLFICYAVVYELASGERTVEYAVQRLFRDGRGNFDLCERKIFSRIFALYRSVRKTHTEQEVRRVYEKVSQNAAKKDAKDFASGKDYILPSLYGTFKREFRKSVKMEAFKMLLASNCGVTEDPYLRRRIRRVCGS